MTAFTYPHKIKEVTVAGYNYKMAVASNLDELYNALLAKDKNDEDVTDERIPYWAELWPSAIALGEYIANNKEIFSGKSVLEIGCGLGLSGMIASRFAKNVLFTDYMQPPLDFVRYNCLQNDMNNVSQQILDWRKPDKSLAADILIAADVAYERRMFTHLVRAFKHLVKKGGLIIVSEPDRHYARIFFNSLEEKGFEKHTSILPVHLNNINYNINVHVLRDKGKM